MRTLALLFITLPIFAQDAKVLELQKADAARAKTAYAALQKAQAEWDATKRDIKDRYTAANSADHSITVVGGKEYKTAWAAGFEFSENFAFIVPKVDRSGDWISSGIINGSSGTGTITGVSGTVLQPTPVCSSSIGGYACSATAIGGTVNTPGTLTAPAVITTQ